MGIFPESVDPTHKSEYLTTNKEWLQTTRDKDPSRLKAILESVQNERWRLRNLEEILDHTLRWSPDDDVDTALEDYRDGERAWGLQSFSQSLQEASNLAVKREEFAKRLPPWPHVVNTRPPGPYIDYYVDWLKSMAESHPEFLNSCTEYLSSAVTKQRTRPSRDQDAAWLHMSKRVEKMLSEAQKGDWAAVAHTVEDTRRAANRYDLPSATDILHEAMYGADDMIARVCCSHASKKSNKSATNSPSGTEQDD